MQVAMHLNSFNLALVRVRHLKIVPRPEVSLSVTFMVHTSIPCPLSRVNPDFNQPMKPLCHQKICQQDTAAKRKICNSNDSSENLNN